jgi:predicted MFS family arabinose efflux permease
MKNNPQIESGVASTPVDTSRREHFLRLLAGITFLVFFQAYMVAPMIPRLASYFHTTAETIGLAVPAYLIPYGVSTLFYGLLSDWIGRRRIMLASLLAFALLTGLTVTAQSATQMIIWRLLTGFGASGVVPLALALIGDLYPYQQRGRPLGWLFGAMAGGMAFGSTFGVLLEPALGWRGVFLTVSGFGVIGVLVLQRYSELLGQGARRAGLTLQGVFAGYQHLLTLPRGARTYAYVLLNAIFHSGVFTWLGLYFNRRYQLGEIGIGLALLGYGIPGFVLGPLIGRAADRWGRRRLIPSGLGIAALAAATLIARLPLGLAAVAVTILSLGYDMTQPLLAGIVTSLDRARGGQAMGLNVFALFTGFGIGSLLFGWALQLGFAAAFLIFSLVQMFGAILSVGLFRKESAERATNS